MIIHRLRVSPLQAVVLLHHVIHCPDASNDADRTVKEIVREIDEYPGHLPKGLLESALYCCNMEDERENFWHPLGQSFDRFVQGIFGTNKQLAFDKYYNVIYEKKNDGPKEKTSND